MMKRFHLNSADPDVILQADTASDTEAPRLLRTLPPSHPEGSTGHGIHGCTGVISGPVGES